MALKKVKGTLDRVLDKNLQDLVRGIRNHKDTEAKFIAECIDEIKQELKQENVAIKANAVNKLTYLQMLSYDISWAAFNIIEVMSSSKFTQKRVGYLAASQSFHEGTDVLMLTTNMIRKDLSSQNMYDAGVALNGLSCFITPDLARDLANDIMTLMTSSRPYLRKKGVLIMYKVFLQFPEALRPAFPRLKEKLEDPDPGVQSAAVNVICELARKNPKNYLSLAPLFFKLMTSSTNNWVLIKIIKLFGALTPLEPRLGKKLIEPLTNLIHSTSAMSLLYECINTVIAGIPNHTASIQLCVQKLRILIEDSDQNLKYLGLLAMSRILATHPKSVQTHKDLVLQCLDDKDESIRLRALDLLYGMVSKKNLMEIVKKLMIHMDKAEGSHYRDELLSKIVQICSQSNYQYVTNFEWYVSILVELTRMEGTRHGRLIASQMLDVAIRVQAIRQFAVAQMALLLENSHVLASNSQRNGICEVLYAAAWICGEFSEHLKDTRSTLESMLRPKISGLPGHIQSVFVQNMLKLFGKILQEAEEAGDEAVIQEVSQLMLDKLPVFVQSSDLEVQERACTVLNMVKYMNRLREKGSQVGEEVQILYGGDLNPVAPKAQRKVPVPEGLDLDAWINKPLSDSSDDEVPSGSLFVVGSSGLYEEHRSAYQNDVERKVPELTEEELERRREQRKIEQAHNPHYLKGDTKTKPKNDMSGYNDIPVAEIDLTVPLHVPGVSTSDKYLKLAHMQSSDTKSKKKKKTRKGKKRKGKGEASESEEDVPVMHAVSTVVDAPEGPGSDRDDENQYDNDPYKKLDINLDEPLRDDEILPVPQHRVVASGLEGGAEAEAPRKKHREKTKDKSKKKDKKEKDKKEKKKKHRNKEEPALLMEEAGAGEEEAAQATPATPAPADLPLQQNPADEKANDIEFWLSTSEISATPASTPAASSSAGLSVPTVAITKPTNDVPSSEEEDAGAAKEPKKKKEKKVKREKKEKKKKKERARRSEYEQPEGITTPSKEQLTLSQEATPMDVQLPPMSSYQLLAENAALKMMYETRVSPQRSDQIIVSVVFSNLTMMNLKDLEFNVLDTLNTKMVRGMGHTHHDPVKVPFVLLPGAQNEGQFAFSTENITVAQKLRGTLTYILKSEDGSTHEKVDFKLGLPSSAYLVSTPSSSADFAALLSNGDLSAKSSAKIPAADTVFAHILVKVCFHLHFRVVEQVANTASLFARSIQGHPVCLLVKSVEEGVNVDGKSSDNRLLDSVMSEIKDILAQTSS